MSFALKMSKRELYWNIMSYVFANLTAQMKCEHHLKHPQQQTREKDTIIYAMVTSQKNKAKTGSRYFYLRLKTFKMFEAIFRSVYLIIDVILAQAELKFHFRLHMIFAPFSNSLISFLHLARSPQL